MLTEGIACLTGVPIQTEKPFGLNAERPSGRGYGLERENNRTERFFVDSAYG